MSAWGLLAAPLLVHGPAPATTIQDPIVAPVLVSETDDLFGGLAIMDDVAMSAASGGAATAVEVDYLGVNIADNNGVVTDISADGATTGLINDILVEGNGGITTVFFNTGIGVIFQSNVNVNIFMDGDNAP